LPCGCGLKRPTCSTRLFAHVAVPDQRLRRPAVRNVRHWASLVAGRRRDHRRFPDLGLEAPRRGRSSAGAPLVCRDDLYRRNILARLAPGQWVVGRGEAPAPAHLLAGALGIYLHAAGAQLPVLRDLFLSRHRGRHAGPDHAERGRIRPAPLPRHSDIGLARAARHRDGVHDGHRGISSQVGVCRQGHDLRQRLHGLRNGHQPPARRELHVHAAQAGNHQPPRFARPVAVVPVLRRIRGAGFVSAREPGSPTAAVRTRYRGPRPAIPR
jgi:hypothetical protein